MLYSAVFGIVSAMVGAGFASGREIMHFFSRFGPLSWALVMLAALFTCALISCLMETETAAPNGKTGRIVKICLLPLFAAAGGAMTAAAGELVALTVPLLYARFVGGLLTLCAGVVIARKPIVLLGVIGKILVPLLLLAFFFCLRLPVEPAAKRSVPETYPLIALIQLVGYCGLNVTLSAGVIREAGQNCISGEKKKISLYTGIMIGLLLCAGNAALLPHADAQQHAALPVVTLLRNYGKVGFYLCAGVLYLAVLSTLAAILRTMRGLFPPRVEHSILWAGLLCAVSSLLGFEEIVGLAYPALGWLGILLIFGRKFLKRGTVFRFASSIGRRPNKEEGNR
ncbi:MAG: hypothetical protein IKH30_20265 [Clostridia bacterium]|nr:hypothetical protein [Clostridia bacterium]